MEIQFSYNKAEAKERWRLTLKSINSRELRILNATLSFLFVCSGVLLGFYAWSLVHGLPGILLGMLVGGVSLTLLLMQQGVLTMPISDRKEVWNLRVTPTGMNIEMIGHPPQVISWTDIESMELLERFVKLNFKKPNHFLIPRRAFADEAEMQKFLMLIEQYRQGTGNETLSPNQQKPWWRNRYAVEESPRNENRLG